MELVYRLFALGRLFGLEQRPVTYRQLGLEHALAYILVFGQRLRLAEQLERLLYVLGTEVLGAGRIVYAEVGFGRSIQPALQQVKVLQHLFGRRTVIAAYEVLDQSHGILIRIPQKLGYYPALQLYELGLAPLRGGTLLEYAAHMVLYEVADVGREHAEIGEGHYIVVEVDHVIPYVQPVTDLGPTLQILLERRTVYAVAKAHN